MAKGAYIGVSSVARKVKKMYIGVGGVARKVKKAYIGVGGKARLFWSGDTNRVIVSKMTANSNIYQSMQQPPSSFTDLVSPVSDKVVIKILFDVSKQRFLSFCMNDKNVYAIPVDGTAWTVVGQLALQLRRRAHLGFVNFDTDGSLLYQDANTNQYRGVFTSTGITNTFTIISGAASDCSYIKHVGSYYVCSWQNTSYHSNYYAYSSTFSGTYTVVTATRQTSSSNSTYGYNTSNGDPGIWYINGRYNYASETGAGITVSRSSSISGMVRGSGAEFNPSSSVVPQWVMFANNKVYYNIDRTYSLYFTSTGTWSIDISGATVSSPSKASSTQIADGYSYFNFDYDNDGTYYYAIDASTGSRFLYSKDMATWTVINLSARPMAIASAKSA